jgi:hypothetical protein
VSCMYPLNFQPACSVSHEPVQSTYNFQFQNIFKTVFCLECFFYFCLYKNICKGTRSWSQPLMASYLDTRITLPFAVHKCVERFPLTWSATFMFSTTITISRECCYRRSVNYCYCFISLMILQAKLWQLLASDLETYFSLLLSHMLLSQHNSVNHTMNTLKA